MRPNLRRLPSLLGISLSLALTTLIGDAHAATFWVTNTNDTGAGSLRQAILSANASSGQDVIQFSITLPAGAVATIAPLTPLPDITEAVSILGYSQPGSVKNSLAAGFNAVLRLRLSGASAGPAAPGLVIKSAGVTIDGLIIDGFGGAAIHVAAGSPSSVVAVSGCVLGKGYGGLPLAANGHGVRIEDVPNVRVGGLQAEDRNLIAGNRQEGVLASGASTKNTSVLGNRIGLNDAGTAEGNRYGVRLTGGGFISIGNHLGMGGNVVAASAEADVQVEGGSFGIYGNRIGTDDAGLASRGSTVGILVIGATTGAIGVPGSPTATGRNIVVASSRAIELRQASGVTVANNYVCRNASGAAIGTCGTGLLVQEGGSHTIGGHYVSGTRFSQGNVVANCRLGIELSQTSGNAVEANTIEDNAGAGVLVSSSSNNLIGSLYDTALGGSLGNTIRRNGGGSVAPRGGIVVTSGPGNAILRNSISDNAPLGIDLGGDGETFNDKHDADTGPNNGQNYPALFRVTVGATTQVEGTLASLPSQTYRLQLFRSAALNASGHAEGQVYFGETTVTTDAADHAFWTVTLPAISPGTIVTATATRLSGTTPVETSEFSPGLPAGASAPPTITAVTPPSGLSSGGTVLTVTGSYFFITMTTVTIGGTAATDVLVLTPTTLVATTPAHVAGIVDVAVTTPVGSASRANAFTYTPSGPTDTPLMAALGRLRAASLEPLEVEFEKGVPVRVAGRVPAGTGSERPWARASRFLDEYRDLYQIVSDGSVRFRPSRQHMDADGTSHVFLQQVRESIPVLGAGIALHFRGNDFTSSNGRWISSLSRWYTTGVETSPTIAFQVAFERAVTHVGGGNPDPSNLVGKPGLVFYWPEIDHDATWTAPPSSPAGLIGPNDLPRLAWRLTILAPGGPWDYVVDARDGTVLEATTRQRTAFNLEIFDARGDSSWNCFNWPDDPSVFWGDEDGQGDRAPDRPDGDLAYESIQTVYWHYRNTYDRDSYDGEGSQIEIFFNVGNDQWGGSPNASWISGPGCQIITFADGYPTLDIVGHEFTHGVTADTADLVYRRMAGAINEHMSDVFGALVDANEWWMGDELPGNGNGCGAGAPAGTFRDMADPPNCVTSRDFDGDGNNDPFPDHVDPVLDGGGIGLRRLNAGQDPADSNDYGYVHINSSIPNKAAYLVAAGGTHNGITVTGLGREPLGQIWYRALVRYLDDRSPFRDLRWTTRRAARDLYGQASNEECQVTNALASVGIGAADSDCDGIDNDLEDDDDGDFIPDNGDNCPQVPNPDQANTDGVGQGDACDPDIDNDGLLNDGDNCPLVTNPGQGDFDDDGDGDACDDFDGDLVMDDADNCRRDYNHYQTDSDGDGIGDACDTDADGDGRANALDNCPLRANPGWIDSDDDGLGNACDNCELVDNADQANNDGDRWGDACDADDDNDRVLDADDVCQFDFDPEQVDTNRNGIGLRCDADEAFVLGGNPGWSMIDVPILSAAPVELPVFPCVDDDCPTLGEPFAPGQRYTLRLSNTTQLDARIVDQAGRVVARGVRGADGQTLSFVVAPAFRAVSSASLPAAAAVDDGRVSAAAVNVASPWAAGPDEPAYFLQLRPLSPDLVGHPVTLAVSAGLHTGPDTDGDGVTDNVDSCVAVPDADQADSDGDGLGDVCDNCSGAANGPALPLGGLAAQADADADATGDACDLPRFLAEGATGAFFDTEVALFNPTATNQRLTLRFQTGDGAVVTDDVTVAPTSRVTIDPESLSGLGDAAISLMVDSAGPVLVDRTMSWDATGYGSHLETAVLAPALTWYFAEGATHSGFDLFYLLQNPDEAHSAEVEVTYLRPGGRSPVVRAYSVAPHSRFNIWVDLEGPELSDTDVSAVLRVTNGIPIIVERAMYLGASGRFFDAGHGSAGVTAPATRWLLAEGATGPFFDLFVLVANPSASPARVRATYLLPDGSTLARDYEVAPLSRFNIWVDYEDARLADTAVSTILDSTDGVPIIVERAMWWGTGGQWYEAHSSPGATTTGTLWGLAAGEVGGLRGAETYILIANTSAGPASARVTLFFEGGATAERTFALAGSSRFNVAVAHEFPEAAGQRFGATVESLGDPPARLVVERAMYTSAGGVFWAAGTNALAIRLK